jgi:hypothetical protein
VDLEALRDADKKVQEEQRLVQTALIGYAKADFLKMAPTFGTWNDRVVVQSEVKKLLASMQTEGVQRYVARNLIPIVVPKQSIAAGSVKQEPGLGGDEFPLLTWNENGPPDIHAAGGQHRFEALSLLRGQYTALAKRQRLELNKAKESKPVNEDMVKSAERRLAQTTDILEGLGMWGFIIYDYGACYLTHISL